MADHLLQALGAAPALRRWAWRAGRRLYCAARGEPRTNDIAANGEAYVQACVAAAVPIDTTLVAVDIGANRGAWSLSLLHALSAERRRRRNVRLDAFEPVPTTVERLRTALARDELGNTAHIHCLAMSDQAGDASIAVMSDTGGTNTLHPDDSRIAPPGGWAQVATTTLAQFCTEHGIDHVHLAKSDTEGHDLAVLRGARALLQEGRIDVFQFEYNHRWVFSRSYLKDVFDLTDGLAYKIARIMPTHVEVFDGWHHELERYFEANYVLIHARALGWLGARHASFNESNVTEVGHPVAQPPPDARGA